MAESKAEKEAKAKAKKVDEAVRELHRAGVKFQEGESDFVNQLLDQADELREEKEAVYDRISANRDTLRNVLRTGLLSEAQARGILDLYPPVTRAQEERQAA